MTRQEENIWIRHRARAKRFGVLGWNGITKRKAKQQKKFSQALRRGEFTFCPALDRYIRA